jgi:type II secretory pathway component PulJ
MKRHILGFTLAETLVSLAVFSIVSAGVIAGVVSLLQTYNGSTNYAKKHAAEMRISDYLALDLRRAQSVTISGTGSGTVVTLNIPNYYGTLNGNAVHCLPQVTGSAVYYQANGANSVQVQYRLSNGSLLRIQAGGISNGRLLTGSGTSVLATSVQDFQLNLINSGTETINAVTTDGFLIPLATASNNRVAEVLTQVCFGSTYTNKPTTDQGTAFYNTTLMRNSLQNSLYSGTTAYTQ